jgi:hypothetical protein
VVLLGFIWAVTPPKSTPKTLIINKHLKELNKLAHAQNRR